jgi:DNA-directed RNA polymerase subunit RPC12/RpoP
MDEAKKKKITLAIAIVCILGAAFVTFRNVFKPDNSGIDGLKPGVMFLMKCNNPDCGHKYEIDRKEFYEHAQKFPMAGQIPPMACPKCNKASAFHVYRCAKCGNEFFAVSSKDYEDRCPKCSFSQMEQDRIDAAKK